MGKKTYPQIQVITPEWSEYELLDSGDGEKLERFGPYLVSRGEPKAWWKKSLPKSEWNQVHATHKNDKEWQIKKKLPKEWHLSYHGVKLAAHLSQSSKHLGVFPEQEAHWKWIREQLSPEDNLLSLFGYTGATTLNAADCGAKITNIDASKPSVSWARKNQDISGLSDKPIRWITDDVRKFITREVKRKSKYHAMVLDPPSFGRGTKGELWKIEKDLRPFLENLSLLLSNKPKFILMTLYAVESSPLVLHNMLSEMMKSHKGNIEIGELAVPQKNSSRLLPLSFFARWTAG